MIRSAAEEPVFVLQVVQQTVDAGLERRVKTCLAKRQSTGVCRERLPQLRDARIELRAELGLIARSRECLLLLGLFPIELIEGRVDLQIRLLNLLCSHGRVLDRLRCEHVGTHEGGCSRRAQGETILQRSVHRRKESAFAMARSSGSKL